MNENISIILLSLFVSVISTLAATVFGVLISLVILFKDFRLKKLAENPENNFKRKEALEAGKISSQRYDNYIKIYNNL